MGKKRIEGRITVLTPLHHGGDEKTGSTPMLRAIDVICDGRRVRVPYISGNAIRGRLRRLLYHDLLEQCRINAKAVSKKVIHILASGGVLELGKSSGCIDLNIRNRVRDTIPLARLLGCSIGNQILSGRLIVGHAVPISRETAGMMVPATDAALLPIRELTGNEFITRRDEVREREEDEAAVQMKVEFEVLLPGVQLFHYFQLEDDDALCEATLARAITLWKSSPYIGGRSSSGFGEMHLEYAAELSEEPYLEFVAKNKDAITALVEELG